MEESRMKASGIAENSRRPKYVYYFSNPPQKGIWNGSEYNFGRRAIKGPWK